MTDTTRLSNRQYTMLQMFASESKDFVLLTEAARGFDQRAFRSMLIRQYITYLPSVDGFKLTALGRSAFHTFEATDITRKDPSLPLTKYFDPALYIRRRRAAAA